MRRLVVVAVLATVMSTACSSKPKPEPKPEEESTTSLTSKLGGFADRAKSVGGDVADKAKSVGGDVANTAKSVGADVVQTAMQVAAKAGEISVDAFASGKALKDQLHGNLELAKIDYDIAVDAMPVSESEHAARLAGMKQLHVGAYTVGIMQDSKHPLGTAYKWQFRITWRVLDGREIRLSLFTNAELPDLELAAMLAKVLPLAERVVTH